MSSSQSWRRGRVAAALAVLLALAGCAAYAPATPVLAYGYGAYPYYPAYGAYPYYGDFWGGWGWGWGWPFFGGAFYGGCCYGGYYRGGYGGGWARSYGGFGSGAFHGGGFGGGWRR